MLLGMNMAQAINPMTAAPVQAPAPTPAQEAAAPASHTASMSVEEQVEAMKKMKELVDIGILSQEEFDAKTRNSRPINGAFMQLETVDNEGNVGAVYRPPRRLPKKRLQERPLKNSCCTGRGPAAS